jgi:hypothetical protein
MGLGKGNLFKGSMPAAFNASRSMFNACGVQRFNCLRRSMLRVQGFNCLRRSMLIIESLAIR